MNNEHIYLFSIGTIKLLKPNVLLIEYQNGIPISVEHIIETRDLRKKIIGDLPYYPIIDMRKGFINFTKEAKQWVADNFESSTVRMMDFLLVPNWATKMEATLYLKVFKPRVITKVILSIEEAFDFIDIDETERISGVGKK